VDTSYLHWRSAGVKLKYYINRKPVSGRPKLSQIYRNSRRPKSSISYDRLQTLNATRVYACQTDENWIHGRLKLPWETLNGQQLTKITTYLNAKPPSRCTYKSSKEARGYGVGEGATIELLYYTLTAKAPSVQRRCYSAAIILVHMTGATLDGRRRPTIAASPQTSK